MPRRNLRDPAVLSRFANRLLDQEIGALQALREQIEVEELSHAVQRIVDCEGMVIVVGAGTSSSIARRLAHLLTCSGRPAFFLDPGQARHGYSGVIRQQDVLIAFSRGGHTDEVNHVLGVARGRGAKTVGIMENTESAMAALSDTVLCARVSPENDAVDVIPLASTLVHAAVGDILCAAVLELCGYDTDEFAQLHPGGAVGKRLGQSGDPRT